MDQFSPYDEEFFPDILRGLSVCFDSPFVLNIARTVQKYRRPDLAIALNRKQIACKKWLIDHLLQTYGGRHDKIWVLGGWYGVLSALIFADPRLTVGSITSIDVDEDCAPVAESLNREQALDGRFRTMTFDMLDLDYENQRPDLVVNTSCEHLVDFNEWFARIPHGTRLALQSNNYFGEPDHINCANSLEEFRDQAPLSRVDYAGELPLKHYTRYMLIGRR
jgi:hypothetical protein